jgi:hypothetical protein
MRTVFPSAACMEAGRKRRRVRIWQKTRMVVLQCGEMLT